MATRFDADANPKKSAYQYCLERFFEAEYLIGLVPNLIKLSPVAKANNV